MPRLDSPTLLLDGTWTFPRKFLYLWVLAIASHYTEEPWSWEVRLLLSGKAKFPQWNQRGLERSLELRLLVSSKEVALRYLEENYNLSEVFGKMNQLLPKALEEIKYSSKNNGPVLHKVRRKGYQDKGTWRSPDRWTPTEDYTLTQEHLDFERKLLLFDFLYYTYLNKLKD